MGKVYCALIRHGEFARPEGMPSAHLPHPLTASGRDQSIKGAHRVLEMADRLGAEIDSTIECSTLRRAFETARLLKGELETLLRGSFVLREDPALMERGVGSGANLTLAEIEAIVRSDERYPDPPLGWRRNPHYRLPLPGAESQMDAGARCAERLRAGAAEAARDKKGDVLRLFVGHGGSLRHASVVVGATPLNRVVQISMDHVQPVVLEARADGSWAHVCGDWKERTRAEGGV